MKANKPVTGIILSGGSSSRMGTDKAMVLFNNRPFLYWISKALRPVVDSILIVSNNQKHRPFGDRLVKDIHPNQGPLMGVYSGLMASVTEQNLVLSCDLPTVSTEVLRPLMDARNANRSLITYQAQDGRSPIAGLFDKSSCLPAIQGLLDRGERKYQSILEAVDTLRLPIPSDWSGQLRDINTPIQLKEVQHDINY